MFSSQRLCWMGHRYHKLLFILFQMRREHRLYTWGHLMLPWWIWSFGKMCYRDQYFSFFIWWTHRDPVWHVSSVGPSFTWRSIRRNFSHNRWSRTFQAYVPWFLIWPFIRILSAQSRKWNLTSKVWSDHLHNKQECTLTFISLREKHMYAAAFITIYLCSYMVVHGEWGSASWRSDLSWTRSSQTHQ